MGILSVIGTRPQIMKIDSKWNSDHEVIWTGQHYDRLMKEVFFQDIDINGFDYELETTDLVKMIKGLKKIFKTRKPSCVLVYGDCRSTLAGAIAASDMNIPIVHIESGKRSYNSKMPEERIRVMVDHMSDLLFCTDWESKENLKKEGIEKNVYVVGNTMFDTLNSFCPMKKSKNEGKYSYLTIHRQVNADSPVRIEKIFEGIKASKEKFIFPCHPRTLKTIKKNKIEVPDNIKITEPVSYKKNLGLIAGARRVLTDSGGVQSEAYWLGVPCGVLRKETEWNDYVKDGWAELLNDDPIDIELFMKKRFMRATPRPHMPKYGAKQRIKDLIYEFYG